MVTVIFHSAQVRVPSSVVDLASFRHWADADDFPNLARVWYLQGEIWVDLSREEIFRHVLVKGEIACTLAGLTKVCDLGTYLIDGALLTNKTADICGRPDGLFIANATLKAGRVRFVKGVAEGFSEVEGSPDMVLEVISPTSEHKDTVVLREAYWQAGMQEYWLVDARGEAPVLEILRRTARGYTASRKVPGWVRSAVFGKAFRLVAATTPLGHPSYTLEVR
jgi:hypothetical protein